MPLTDFLYGRDGVSRHADLSMDRLSDYYHGSQPLAFLTPDVRRALSGRLRTVVLNLPRLVVDSIEDRLDVEGFRLGGDQDADADLWRVWQANDLDEESQQAHLEALIYGRSFVMVWVDPDDEQTPRITVESARLMQVEYDPTSRRVLRAVKLRADEEYQYRTTYDQRWITLQRRALGQRRVSWEMRGEPVENVLGVVPVVPLVNRPTLARPQGESEMTDVIPIADAINKLCTDMMTTADHYAAPRRWATGIDLGGSDAAAERVREELRQRWSQAEKDRVWLSTNAQSQFGQFPEAQLDNFVAAVDMLTARAAALAGLPPHYFGQVGQNPASADALRSSEASLVKRAQRRQRVFGGAWERVMRLALLVRDGEVPAAARSMETIWRSAETPTVAQKMDAAVKGVEAGIIDQAQAQEDLGYTPTQIQSMAERRATAQLGAVRVQIDEADRLQREQGLSQRAAYAAVGLLQAAAAME